MCATIIGPLGITLADVATKWDKSLHIILVVVLIFDLLLLFVVEDQGFIWVELFNGYGTTVVFIFVDWFNAQFSER